jgi:hypothetical protein
MGSKPIKLTQNKRERMKTIQHHDFQQALKSAWQSSQGKGHFNTAVHLRAS